MSARLVSLAVAVWLAAAIFPLMADEGLISPGDTLRITVLGEPDYSRQVVVDDSGRISLPLAKDVVVAGKTTAGASAAIAERLGKYLKNPDVTVEVLQRAIKRVTVAGQVRVPGVYPLGRETRVMEVLGLAGGFTEAADTASVSVTRRGGAEAINCNLQAFLAGTEEAANIVLQDGDVILITEKTPALGTVFVYGSVRAPGQPIQLREGMRISHAISAAGGVVPEQADMARATLKRSGQDEQVQIDLAKALAGDSGADVTLQHGDTITVPAVEQTGSFTIYGAVANSGEFPVRGKMTVSKALAAAGGPTPRAKVTDIRLARPDDGGTSKAMKINLDRISDGTAEDPVVQPGDTLYVPGRPDRPDFARFVAIAVSLVGILLRN